MMLVFPLLLFPLSFLFLLFLLPPHPPPLLHDRNLSWSPDHCVNPPCSPHYPLPEQPARRLQITPGLCAMRLSPRYGLPSVGVHVLRLGVVSSFAKWQRWSMLIERGLAEAHARRDASSIDVEVLSYAVRGFASGPYVRSWTMHVRALSTGSGGGCFCRFCQHSDNNEGDDRHWRRMRGPYALGRGQQQFGR